jgi:hypothetical protein
MTNDRCRFVVIIIALWHTVATIHRGHAAPRNLFTIQHMTHALKTLITAFKIYHKNIKIAHFAKSPIQSEVMLHLR